MTPGLAIGVGCRRKSTASTILDVIREACGGKDLTGATLFTHERKRDEPGLMAAAESLGLPVVFLSADDLAAETGRVGHCSERVAALVGVPSIAEAAALAGAGPGGRLIVTKVAHAMATCAVAAREGPSP